MNGLSLFSFRRSGTDHRRRDEFGSSYLSSADGISCKGKRYRLSSLRVKIKVLASAFESTVHLSSADAVFCNFGDSACYNHVLQVRLAQSVSKFCVVNTSTLPYVMTSETSVL